MHPARRFTRFLLPILAAEEGDQEHWRVVAQHQWQLTYPNVRTMLDACVQSTNTWIVIGALLSGHARAAVMGPTWSATLQHWATASTDGDIRDTAQHLLGTDTAPTRWSLSLTDILLFLKRIPLYSSMHLEQLRTVAAHLTECDVMPGGEILGDDAAHHARPDDADLSHAPTPKIGGPYR